jgi:hypothetical protein
VVAVDDAEVVGYICDGRAERGDVLRDHDASLGHGRHSRTALTTTVDFGEPVPRAYRDKL